MQRTITVLLVLLLLAGCSPASTELPYQAITHPDGPLYVGDRVSFEILGPEEYSGETVIVSYNGQELGSATFSPFGIGRRVEAALWWVWNTADLKPGRHLITFTLGNGTTWSERVSLRPASRLPAPEPEAAWTSTVTECCVIHYITGTDAARDITSLAELADSESDAVASQMGVKLDERVPVILMPRVVGHGGFAWDGVYISYLDNSYIGNETGMVLHHEFVHYYDDGIGGEYMPTMLQEGLATYLSGGHFKPEPIGPRAAALLHLGWYIPLEKLANDFYNQQHEIGYLEAAALVQYLYETYGPGAFIEFYRTIPFPDGGSDAETLEDALQDFFGLSLGELESAFTEYLSLQAVTEEIQLDLELTISNYDLVRSYQSLLDPSAYFLTAWLPNGQTMRDEGIVADFLRRPMGWKNRLVEAMLIRAHEDLFSMDYESAGQTIRWTNWVLDVFEP